MGNSNLLARVGECGVFQKALSLRASRERPAELLRFLHPFRALRVRPF